MTQQQYTILIVEDCAEDRELYRRYLLRDSAHSYNIVEAESGQQGLDLWQQYQRDTQLDAQLDVILLDYLLPDMDGIEFLHQLQSANPEYCLPIIFITGLGNESIAAAAIKAGAQDYLIKGQLTAEQLHMAIDSAIHWMQLRTQLTQQAERERMAASLIQTIKKIQQSSELKAILQTTVDEVRQFLTADRVLFFQFQPDNVGLVVAESVAAEWRSILSEQIHDPCLTASQDRIESDPLEPDRPEAVTYDPDFTQDSVSHYRQGQVTVIDDIHCGKIAPCHVQLLKQFQVQANLVVPIVFDQQCWGLLIVHHCAAPRRWRPLEVALLQELASPIGVAIRQAELYQQLQHELIERQQAEAELRRSKISRSLVGDMLRDLQIQGNLSDTAMFEAGQELAGRVDGKTLDEFLDAFASMGLGTLALLETKPNRWIFTGDKLVSVNSGQDQPTCHYPRGYLCGTIAHLTQTPGQIAAVEMECQSMDDPNCVFIVQATP